MTSLTAWEREEREERALPIAGRMCVFVFVCVCVCACVCVSACGQRGEDFVV